MRETQLDLRLEGGGGGGGGVGEGGCRQVEFIFSLVSLRPLNEIRQINSELEDDELRGGGLVLSKEGNLGE